MTRYGRPRARLNGDDDRAGWSWPYRIAVGLALFGVLGCIPAAAWDFNADGFVPSVRELGSLPGGLAIRGAGGDSECGTGRCAVAYPLVGRADESADQVARRMLDNLASRGLAGARRWAELPPGRLASGHPGDLRGDQRGRGSGAAHARGRPPVPSVWACPQPGGQPAALSHRRQLVRVVRCSGCAAT
ncbi:hypothetical protein GCM10010169_22450 [Micromonospora fulviviridis]|nr:hypothetical protein GCM10010169_22450 [Micromonospora fulviviridis]